MAGKKCAASRKQRGKYTKQVDRTVRNKAKRAARHVKRLEAKIRKFKKHGNFSTEKLEKEILITQKKTDRASFRTGAAARPQVEKPVRYMPAWAMSGSADATTEA